MKYKVGDVTVWQNEFKTQHYEITDVIDNDAYKLKLIYDSEDRDLNDYHDWSEKEWVDSSLYCRLLTPLDKLI